MSATSWAAPVPVVWQGWTALAEHPVAYPALEVVHLIGLGLLLGPLAVLDLRLWGWARGLDVRALARLALPAVAAGFALAAGSGLLMFSTQPQDLLVNRFFLGKMVLIGIAGFNAAVFHLRASLDRNDSVARIQTLLSLVTWIGVIICGRWVAYA